MGLNFKGTNICWSYSGFNIFRRELAKLIDVDLKQMRGFGGKIPWETVDDDIVPFLHHSDCDGQLTVSQLKKVAPRLEELANKWDDHYTDYSDHKSRALELAAFMRKRIKRKLPLIFT